jgi:hypothetical protein
VDDGQLKLPREMELRGPTHDEALLARVQQPVYALTAPVGDKDCASMKQRNEVEEEEDKAEAERIREELADELNSKGV